MERRKFLTLTTAATTTAIAGCQEEEDELVEIEDDRGLEGTDEEPEIDNDTEEEQAEGAIFIPQEHENRQEHPHNYQQLNTNLPIFQNTDHTEQPQYEIPVDTAPRIYHQPFKTLYNEGESAQHIEDVVKKAYEEGTIPEEIDGLNVAAMPFIDFVNHDKGEEITEFDTELLLEAETELEALGQLHSLVWRVEQELDNEPIAPSMGRPNVQKYGIEHAINQHPNDLEIRITPVVTGHVSRAMAYCSAEDTLRFIELGIDNDAMLSHNHIENLERDLQRFPKIEQSHYIVEHPEHGPQDAINDKTAFDNIWDEDIGIEQKMRLQQDLYNTVAQPIIAREGGRGFGLSSTWDEGNVAFPPGFLHDFGLSKFEYNENTVDFEEDILSTLGNAVESTTRKHPDQYFVMDYAPGNDYDGELNGDYMIKPEDEETFEEVKNDIDGTHNHFFE